MQELHLSGEKNFGGKSVKLNLPVIFFQEENMHYAYIPSFELMENPRKLTPSPQMKLTPLPHFKLTP